MCKNRICDIINPQGVSDMDYPTMKDIKILNLLRRGELMTLDIYQDLKSLELSHGIGSSAYLKRLDDLKNTVFLEEDLFEKQQDYFIYIYNILDEIIEHTDEIEDKLVKSDSELANIRIHDKASKIFVDIVQGDHANIIKQNIKIGHHVNLLMLSLLNQKIEQIDNFELKKKVTTIKYNEIYTYDTLESRLLKKDMRIPSPEKCITKLKKYSNIDYFAQLISEIYNYYIDLLFQYKVDDIDAKAAIIYILNKIKTSLLLFPENIVEQLYKSVEIDKKKSNQIYQKNPYATDSILQLFEEVREERKHYQK